MNDLHWSPCMSPFTDPVLELRLVAQKAEEAASAASIAQASHADMEDHRAAVLGDLLDAIDRIDAGLGARLLRAMYPRAAAPHCERRGL